MQTKPMFCLEGCGYLNDIVQREGKYIATLKVISPYEEGNPDPDDVMINSEIELFEHGRLMDLLFEVRKGHSVIVSFKAEYCSFMYAFFRHDPQVGHIVSLNCKRLKLGSCYVDGKLWEPNRIPWLNAA